VKVFKLIERYDPNRQRELSEEQTESHGSAADHGDPISDRARRLCGQREGTPRTGEDGPRRKLEALPVATIPQRDANDALMRLRDGKVTGRLVLKTDVN
jgi:hypothetical protein